MAQLQHQDPGTRRCGSVDPYGATGKLYLRPQLGNG